MSVPESPPPPTKPTLPPFWKWLMRITFAVTMGLFLAPAVYVVKYYALDRPREEALADDTAPDRTAPTADSLPALEKSARDIYERPLECLSAKATLADLAVKDPDPAGRAEASVELGKVAQDGAVIRR